MSDFTIYPAIDLRNGQVVRLRQGDPGRQTVFSTDPIKTAQRWVAEGARWLHVVNLDGALGETASENRRAIEGIASAFRESVGIQLGGGLRHIEDIALAVEAGVSRVIVGTAAIEDPTFAGHALNRFGRLVAFALDVAGDKLMTHGWQRTASQSAAEFSDYLVRSGADTVIYTDINRDGMGTGVDWFTARDLAQKTGLEVIASGGVASLDDIRKVKEAGLSGVIVGRALYDHSFTLVEALSC